MIIAREYAIIKGVKSYKNSIIKLKGCDFVFEVSIENLRKVFEDFYNLTKFMIVLYDHDRKPLFCYPEKMCDFCQCVRKSPELYEKCIECDNHGFDICDATRNPYIYECHMSVIEAIAPIRSGEMNIGYLMFGQIARENKDKIRSSAIKACQQFGINITEDMILKITTADDKYIESAVNMMTMCASYLYTNEIIKNNPDILVYQLKEYLRKNLDQDLSIEAICKQFYISQSKLYKLSKENFGMGISDYIRSLRLKKAQKLLLDTDMPITQVSETVGIYDTNYFIRAFKKQTGTTPLKFRSQKNSFSRN